MQDSDAITKQLIEPFMEQNKEIKELLDKIIVDYILELYQKDKANTGFWQGYIFDPYIIDDINKDLEIEFPSELYQAGWTSPPQDDPQDEKVFAGQIAVDDELTSYMSDCRNIFNLLEAAIIKDVKHSYHNDRLTKELKDSIEDKKKEFDEFNFKDLYETLKDFVNSSHVDNTLWDLIDQLKWDWKKYFEGQGQAWRIPANCYLLAYIETICQLLNQLFFSYR